VLTAALKLSTCCNYAGLGNIDGSRLGVYSKCHMTHPTLLTVEEAAQALRCSRRRVFELLADGTLARGPKYGRQTVITAGSVEAALLANEPAPPATEPTPKRRTPRSLAADLKELAAESRAFWAAKHKRRSSHHAE
jgi:excisionase family DNA binding protein